MSEEKNITPAMIAEYNLSGRPFLHEQGQCVVRGFVESLTLEDQDWALTVRDIEYLNKLENSWSFDREKDEYGGGCVRTIFREPSEGLVSIECYGMVVYIGPHSQSPWTEINWPELDGYEGGPMDVSGLTKRQLKKLQKKLKKIS